MDSPVEDQFFVWSLGASLLAHAATAISIAYFDQSVVFIYLTLALTTSLSIVAGASHEPQHNPEESSFEEISIDAVPEGSRAGNILIPPR
jgi:hypothetical protein